MDSDIKIIIVLAKSIEPTKDGNIVSGWSAPCPHCAETIYLSVNEEHTVDEEICKFTNKPYDCKNCEGAKKDRKGKTIFHVCQSIRGAILHNTNSEWNSLAKFVNKPDGGKFTSQELKEKFVDLLSGGVEVIPIVSICKEEDCDEFCYKNGCQGHSKKSEAKDEDND